MKYFKRKKKEDPKGGEKLLAKLSEGLSLSEQNEPIKRMIEVLKNANNVEGLSGSYQFPNKNLEKDYVDFLKLMQANQAIFDAERKKLLNEMKKQNTFWYKTKSKISAKYHAFKLNMQEIGAFIRHEFHTIKKLIFLINDLFFGARHKNRKLLYGHKDRIINVLGYRKGEVRFNSMVRNITKSAEINKRILISHG